ncbi:MAG: response regulator [Gemmatimonadetes bacterium]|nr:response regulator [Gemmatimonadota bacterium]
MQIIIADDDAIIRKILQRFVEDWGHEPLVAEDGGEAWRIIQKYHEPLLLILDWMMPVLDGPELCRRIRAAEQLEGSYILLLTSREESKDLITGLEAGADDYVKKPFQSAELKARVEVGARVVGLKRKLEARVEELRRALEEVDQLQGLIPICAYCKRIRDDDNFWQGVELYVGARSGAEFSHGICPECHTTHVKPQLEKLMQAKKGDGA